ncbi:MAG TPA: DUF2267 domain-containing protein [Beutenbergiaceae bacterium]|nr:DUF2267 domain-containing protein [Beutenbergiaceae bacterium]
MKYDEFISQIGDHGGPSDRIQADAVSRTVLTDLGKRLQPHEAEDLASQLPEELKESVTVHTEAQQTTDDVDEFIRRVSKNLGGGVEPDQARRYIQGVLRTLRSAVSEGQIRHVRSQLPAGYGPLFE